MSVTDNRKRAAQNERFLRHIERWRRDGDTGIGEAIERVAESLGPKQFAAWLRKWGVDEDCQNDPGKCGEKIPLGPSPGRKRRDRERMAKEENGRLLWKELHSYSQAGEWSPGVAKEFYIQWKSRIPSYGCDCQKEFARLEAARMPVFDTEKGFVDWGIDIHNDVNKKLGKEIFDRTGAWAIRNGMLSKMFSGKASGIISWETFTKHTLLLTQKILKDHPNVAGIAGVPRSGIRAASEIAIRLNVPLYVANKEGMSPVGGGCRSSGMHPHGPTGNDKSGPIVVVEDSTCSGYSISEIRNAIGNSHPVYAVYGASPGRFDVDGYAVNLELPHWFEWNLWNNGQILKDWNVATDWDGVLNDDCSIEDDDDGERYLNWIKSTPAIRHPRSYKIPYIITARREAYREESEAWLKENGILYGELVMFPGTFEERSKTDIGSWKADMARQRGAKIFIESCPVQAEIIASKLHSEICVICTGYQI